MRFSKPEHACQNFGRQPGQQYALTPELTLTQPGNIGELCRTDIAVTRDHGVNCALPCGRGGMNGKRTFQSFDCFFIGTIAVDAR